MQLRLAPGPLAQELDEPRLLTDGGAGIGAAVRGVTHLGILGMLGMLGSGTGVSLLIMYRLLSHDKSGATGADADADAGLWPGDAVRTIAMRGCPERARASRERPGRRSGRRMRASPSALPGGRFFRYAPWAGKKARMSPVDGGMAAEAEDGT